MHGKLTRGFKLKLIHAIGLIFSKDCLNRPIAEILTQKETGPLPVSKG